MLNTNLIERGDMREVVRQKYGAAALTVLEGKGAACCGGNAGGGGASASCCGSGGGDVITGDLYRDVEVSQIPEAALLASLGCGNPTALAQLNAGEVVLDLGSGGGIDVLLSARRVGPTGFAYGLDMTDEMLALAQKNKAEAGATNVILLKGHIEEIPLPDASVDVIISNCVINLSADKDRVLRDAFRVLRPGGRFAVSDVVVDGELPPAVRADMEAFVGCVAGALERSDYVARLSRAGFVDVSTEPTCRYTFADLEGSGTCCSPDVAALPADEKTALDGRVMGAFIRATKPKEAALQSGAANGSMNAMKLSTFKALLHDHPEKPFRLVLPSNEAVPVSFHVTEVAHVQKRFIDCGGKLHTTQTCQLQAWVGPDADHHLQAGKMARVLDLAAKVLPEEQDLDIEIEYEGTVLSQYPVVGHTVTDNAVVLYLASKHTDCLAKESCLPMLPMVTGGTGTTACCGGTGCC